MQRIQQAYRAFRDRVVAIGENLKHREEISHGRH
jgi:hypothetical protein